MLNKYITEKLAISILFGHEDKSKEKQNGTRIYMLW